MRIRPFTILLVLLVAMLILKTSPASGAVSATQQVSSHSSESSSSTSSSSGSSSTSAASSAGTGHAKSTTKEQQAVESNSAGGKVKSVKVKTDNKEDSKAKKDDTKDSFCAGSACSLPGLQTKENQTANSETNDTRIGGNYSTDVILDNATSQTGNWTQNETNETQALANDTQTHAADDSGKEGSLEGNQTSIHEFRDMLDINDSTALKVSLVKKLAELKQSDAENFDNIVQIAQSSLTEPEKKEALVSELADMNSGFVASFSSQAPSPDEQIASYLKSVEQPNTISVNLDDSKISDALNGNKDFDELIKEIW